MSSLINLAKNSKLVINNLKHDSLNKGQYFLPNGYLPNSIMNSNIFNGMPRFRRDKKSVGDRRLILFKNMLVPGCKPLYEHDISSEKKSPEEFLTPMETDFNNKPEQVRQEVIERAWCLEKEDESIKKTQELYRMYKSMHLASENLKLEYPDLYNKIEDDRGLGYLPKFPVELRIPTNTPPTNGWPMLAKDDE